MAEVVYRRGAPPFPFGAVPRAIPRAFILYAGIDPLNLGAHEGKGYLLVMTPFDSALTIDLPAPPYPFGGVPRRRPRTVTIQGRSATIYPAATGNAARSTANDDVPAAQWVGGYLNGNVNYEIALFDSADPTQPGGGSVGIIQLDDPAGELDDLRTLGWDGVPLELRRGEPFDSSAPTDPIAYFSTYRSVAKLTTAGLRYDTLKKEILLRGLDDLLAQAELHGLRYDCSGGLGGDPAIPSLKGRIKPIAFGPVNNITPVLIEAASLIYQASCTSVLAFDAVKDGLAPLDFVADYSTLSDLRDATGFPGDFVTCKALGIFKVFAAAEFIITVDLRGDNDTINSLSYPHTGAQIAKRIATGRGSSTLRDPQDIDGSAFETLEAAQPATVGYFWDEEITKGAALTEVMAGCAGWWTVRLNGLLAVGQLDDPAGAEPRFTIDYDPTDGTTASRLDAPSMTDYQAPRRSTLMGWARNYTVMQTNQIAGSILSGSPDVAAIAQAASRYATAENSWVAAGYPSAKVVTVNGGFAEEAPAQAEANRQSRLFGRMRESFAIPLVMDPYADVAARVARVLNGNRLGLGTSRQFFCFGIAVNANAKPILKLWG